MDCAKFLWAKSWVVTRVWLLLVIIVVVQSFFFKRHMLFEPCSFSVVLLIDWSSFSICVPRIKLHLNNYFFNAWKPISIKTRKNCLKKNWKGMQASFYRFLSQCDNNNNYNAIFISIWIIWQWIRNFNACITSSCVVTYVFRFVILYCYNCFVLQFWNI